MRYAQFLTVPIPGQLRGSHFFECEHRMKTQIQTGGTTLLQLLPKIGYRVIDDNLKRQIKNRTLHSCGLFLLA